MRYLIIFALYYLFAPVQAQACLGAINEDTLFFDAIANLEREADVIAQVTLLNVSILDAYKGTATAKILRVLKSSDTRVHQGGLVIMKYLLTSCGPNERSGSEGTIIAKAGTDSQGHLILYPYMRRYSDSRIRNSCMSELNEKTPYPCK